MNDPRELLSRLAAPFAAEDLEWRLQIAYEDRMQGIAVPYVTNRAIQNRLDDVMGPDRWHNEFKPWHSTGKRESQLCGISLYFEERGWITKWDGAEDSDIEPIKGGLSDSMKRAANQWGIGRVLYSMDTVWVNVEKKGKSFIIKPTERGKLDARYLETLKKSRSDAGESLRHPVPADPRPARGGTGPCPHSKVHGEARAAQATGGHDRCSVSCLRVHSTGGQGCRDDRTAHSGDSGGQTLLRIRHGESP